MKGWKSEIISAQFCEDVSEMATKQHFFFWREHKALLANPAFLHQNQNSVVAETIPEHFSKSFQTAQCMTKTIGSA